MSACVYCGSVRTAHPSCPSCGAPNIVDSVRQRYTLALSQAVGIPAHFFANTPPIHPAFANTRRAEAIR